MANYLSGHRKKLIRMKKLEGALERAVKRGDDAPAVFKAADNLRLARILSLKAIYADIPPHAGNEYKLAALKRQLESSEAATVEDIVFEFTKPTPLP